MNSGNELMSSIILLLVSIYMLLLGYAYFTQSTIVVYKYFLGLGTFCVGCLLLFGDIYMIYTYIKKTNTEVKRRSNNEI